MDYINKFSTSVPVEFNESVENTMHKMQEHARKYSDKKYVHINCTEH